MISQLNPVIQEADTNSELNTIMNIEKEMGMDALLS
jgi:hypothetical protein